MDSGGSKERNLPPIYHQKRQALKMCPNDNDRISSPVVIYLCYTNTVKHSVILGHDHLKTPHSR